MGYDLEQFCKDCRKSIDGFGGTANLESIQQNLNKLLTNEAFIDEYCGPGTKIGTHTIYHDSETNFMFFSHKQSVGKASQPHDHGASWAVYGQVEKYTEMTEYERKDNKSKKGYAEIEISSKYRLEPGQIGFFGPHSIHSIHFPEKAFFVRVTGGDLSKMETLLYDMPNKTVSVVSVNKDGKSSGS